METATTIQTLTKEFRGSHFSPEVEPALRVKGGETFRLEAASLLTMYPDGNIPPVYEKVSIPVTGPVYVEGARPGAILRVEVESIELPTGRGVVLTVPGNGTMGGEVEEFSFKTVTYDEEFVYFNDKVRVPVRKMIGKIGTAPREPVWSSAPGPHGGNLDNNQITEGAVVYLPIYVEGAFLYGGDLHAAQGDGEPFCGVESEGMVVLRVDVRDDLEITDPVVVTPDAVITSGAAVKMEEAVQIATRNAILLLSHELGLSHAEACMLCSIGCDIRLSQVMNPLMGVKVVIPRALIPTSSSWARDVIQ